MKKNIKKTVILALTLGCIVGNSIFASANEQVSNAQIYQKLILIEKRMTEIEKRMTGIEQRMTVLEKTLTLEIKRLDQRIDYLDKRIDYLDKRIDTLNTTMWSSFGIIMVLIVTLIGLIINLSIKIGRFEGVMGKKVQENKEISMLQKKIKELETKLSKVIKHVPKAAL